MKENQNQKQNKTKQKNYLVGYLHHIFLIACKHTHTHTPDERKKTLLLVAATLS
jgi:hypothetical protein